MLQKILTHSSFPFFKYLLQFGVTSSAISHSACCDLALRVTTNVDVIWRYH